MVYSKILTLGGLTAASVGGVSAGTLLLPNMKGEKGIALTSAKEDTAVPKIKKCVVYVTNVPTGTNSNQSVTEILAKHTDIPDFLKDKKTTDSKFVEDVEKACSGKESGKFVDSGEEMHVYIYEKQESGGVKKWIYSSGLQKDWMKTGNVNRAKVEN